MELKITNLESNTEEHNYTVVNEIECEMFTYRNEEDGKKGTDSSTTNEGFLNRICV